MRILLATITVLLFFPPMLQPQTTSRPTWTPERLNQEIDRGTSVDDPGKMIRYWRKITDGTITPHELDVLKILATRPASRECCLRPDDTLYLSAFAGQLVSLYEQRQKDDARFAAQDAKIAELRNQLDTLARTVATLDP